MNAKNWESCIAEWQNYERQMGVGDISPPSRALLIIDGRTIGVVIQNVRVKFSRNLQEMQVEITCDSGILIATYENPIKFKNGKDSKGKTIFLSLNDD